MAGNHSPARQDSEAAAIAGESDDGPPVTTGKAHENQSNWYPILLFAVHAAFAASLTFVDRLGGAWDNLEMLVMGAGLSSHALCAVWAAWAPTAKIWRIPIGVAAFVVFGCFGPRDPGGIPILLIVGSVVFVAFALLTSVLRWFGGWRLVKDVHEAGDPKAAETERFGVRYLFTLTALVAGTLAFAKLLVGDDLASDATKSFLDEVGVAITVSCLFAFLVLPALVGFVTPLASRPRWLLLLFAAPLLVAGCSYGAVQAAIRVMPGGPGTNEIWWTMACLSGGAMAWLFVSALILRAGGYRVVSGREQAAAGDA